MSNEHDDIFGPNANERIFQLTIMLRSKSLRDQNEAIMTFKELPPELMDTANKRLIELLKDKNWRVRMNAVTALENLDLLLVSDMENTTKSLIGLLKDKNQNVRRAAVRVLEEIVYLFESNTTLVLPIENALKEYSTRNRSFRTKTLGGFSGKKTKENIKKCQKHVL